MIGIKLIFLAVAMTLAHFVPVVGVLPLFIWTLGFPALTLVVNKNKLIYGKARFIQISV